MFTFAFVKLFYFKYLLVRLYATKYFICYSFHSCMRRSITEHFAFCMTQACPPIKWSKITVTSVAQIRSLTKWCIKRAENARDVGRGFYPKYRRSPRDRFRRESAVHSLRVPDWQLAPYIDDVSELGLPFHGALPPSVVSGFAAFSTRCPHVTHTFLVLARYVVSL